MQEYFRSTFRKYTIHAGTTEGGEIAQAICRAMNLRDGQCFTASDEIAVHSPSTQLDVPARSRLQFDSADSDNVQPISGQLLSASRFPEIVARQ